MADRAARAAQIEGFALRYARVALGLAFLAAVVGRLGWFGGGGFAAFERYTAQVNSFMPGFAIPYLARAATVFETAFGIALIAGLGLRWVGLGAAILLALFGTAMAISFGITAPLSYSVFSASACALLVSATISRRLR